MKTPRELARRLENAFNKLFVPRKVRITGVLGDGTTEQRVSVAADSDRVYFRPDPFENAVWEPLLRDTSIPLWHGYPVVAEFNETDSEWYIVSTDWNKVGRQEDIQLKYLTNHAQTQHVINEDQVPSDPVWVYRRAMVMLRPEVPADGTFRLYVLEGDLPYEDPDHFFAGYGPFLSASLPGSPNQRWVTHYISTEGYVEIVEGDAHAPADEADNPPPTAPAGTVPVAYVLLQYNSSALTESMIWDARRTVGIIGQGSGSGAIMTGTNAERLALDPSAIDEGTYFYTTDTNKVWQIWNSAWRLAIEPAGLASSDGDTALPWSTNSGGQLTGIKDLFLDAGSGNSPIIYFIGGTNDDQVLVFLQDDGTANRSDLIMSLAGTDEEARFIIEAPEAGNRFEFTGRGDMEQEVSDSATNSITTFHQVAHRTDGTPAAGFGTQLLVQLDDSANNLDDAAAISFEWETATAGSEDTLIRFWLRKGGVALGPFVEFGAAENVFNEGGADIDFRVEGDTDTHALFLRASDNRVGINENAPETALHVTGSLKVKPSTTISLLFDTTAAYGPQMRFTNQGTAVPDWRWGIPGVTNSGDMFLYDNSAGGAGTVMAFKQTGLVGVGTLSPSYDLDVTGVIGVSDNAGDPSTATNKATFYGKDVSGTVEAFAQDEAGNAAQLTPHNFDGPVQPLPGVLHWSQYHRNPYLGVEKWYDIERALLAIEELTSEQFIFTQQLDAAERRDWYMDQARQGTRKPMPSWMKGS